MNDRKIIIEMVTPDKAKPFWERYFTPLLSLFGVIVVGSFALSEPAAKLFINQPPDVEIKLSETNPGIGTRAVAVAFPSDDRPQSEIVYKWEVLGSDVHPREVQGKNQTQIYLPTNKAGTFTLMVTVTDKSGAGKSRTRATTFMVAAEASSTASAVAPPGTPAGDPASRSPAAKLLVLDKDTLLDWSTVTADIIETNGHALVLEAETIERPLIIRSFSGPAPPGSQGKPGAPGTNGGSQQAGGAGQPGEPGGRGEPGKPAKRIVVTVKGDITGNLTITNDGQEGGPGGTGGAGGPGGAGGQGNPAQQALLDCASGPGYGGAGGDGGAGGAGGQGGNGGQAGPVTLRALARGNNATLRISAIGGKPGKAGSAGAPGVPGEGGPEGASGGLCKPAGRSGQGGKPGVPGAAGAAGVPGADAKAVATLGDTNLPGPAISLP